MIKKTLWSLAFVVWVLFVLIGGFNLWLWLTETFNTDDGVTGFILVIAGVFSVIVPTAIFADDV